MRARLEDLVRARLDPLIAVAGNGLGRQSARWVEQALQTAEAELRAAEQRAESYRSALREYSGVQTTPPGSAVAGAKPPSSSDVQALTPQIDRTFIDAIVQMSASNTTFRQEITRQLITASVSAVEREADVQHYRALLDATKAGSAESLPMDVVTKRLASIVAEAKDLTSRFNHIYEEFSRVSLRVAPVMYRIEQPPVGITTRAFGLRNYALLVLYVLVAAPVILGVAFLIQYHMRKFVRHALESASA